MRVFSEHDINVKRGKICNSQSVNCDQEFKLMLLDRRGLHIEVRMGEDSNDESGSKRMML